jgi:hypothetical protein
MSATPDNGTGSADARTLSRRPADQHARPTVRVGDVGFFRGPTWSDHLGMLEGTRRQRGLREHQGVSPRGGKPFTDRARAPVQQPHDKL